MSKYSRDLSMCESGKIQLLPNPTNFSALEDVEDALRDSRETEPHSQDSHCPKVYVVII